MDHSPTIFIAPEPPPFPAPPRTVDLSPLEFILAFIAVIAIPALIYTFFFSVRCPPNPFRRRRQREDSNSDILSTSIENPTTDNKEQLISGVKYQKDSHVKDIGSECPVCLSPFAEGEEVRQLSACKHSFHTYCIDKWLNSHSNCPVCRASVPVKHPNDSNTGTVSASRDNDFHQGLPDAASLV